MKKIWCILPLQLKLPNCSYFDIAEAEVLMLKMSKDQDRFINSYI